MLDLNAPEAHKPLWGCFIRRSFGGLRLIFISVQPFSSLAGLEISQGCQSRFLANALPEGLFRYASKSRAFWRSVNAMAVFNPPGFQSRCVLIIALIVGLESGMQVFGEAGIEPVGEPFGFQDIRVIEFHPLLILHTELRRKIPLPGVPSRSLERKSLLGLARLRSHCMLRRGSLRFPLCPERRLVGARGFEPPTPCSQTNVAPGTIPT